MSLPPMLDRLAGRFQGVIGHRGLHADDRLTNSYDRPHGAIGNKPPILLQNPGSAPSPLP